MPEAPTQPPPLQPEKVKPEPPDAVRTTDVPELNGAEQVVGQLIPAGTLVTVPVPLSVTVSVGCGAGEKVAVTLTGAVPMVKVQGPVPEHAPLQPLNT